MVEYSDSEFCVVMTLNRKDGSSCDIRVYADDDPHELAKEYIYKEGLSKKAVKKLSMLIKTKRDEAMAAHHPGRAVINASSIDDSRSLSMLSSADKHGDCTRVEQSSEQSPERESSTPAMSLSIPSDNTETVDLDLKDKSTLSNGVRSDRGGGGNHSDGPFLEDKPSPDGNSLNENLSKWVYKGAKIPSNREQEKNMPMKISSGTPRSSEQRAASERLHNRYATKMDRQRKLSMSIMKKTDLKVSSSDFRNQNGQRRSVSGNSKYERETAMSQIYYDGLKRQSLKERALEKMKADAEAARAHEERECTFQPTILSRKKSPRRDSVVSAVGPPSSKNQRTPVNSSEMEGPKPQEKYDVYDWLAYHSLVDSQNKFLMKREEVESERAANMNFSPKINNASEAMANRRRSEKLRGYATAGYLKGSTKFESKKGNDGNHDPEVAGVLNDFKKDPPPRLGTSSDESISDVRTEESHEDDISEGFGVQSEMIHNGDIIMKNDQLGGLSFQRHHQDEEVAPSEGRERVGQESAESSIYSSEVLDITNPFDLVDHESGQPVAHEAPVEAGLSYSPSSYIRSQESQREAQMLAQDVDFDTIDPSKRADALFEYLYHGRIETERVRAEAAEKYQEKYTFQPKISRFTNTTIFKKLRPDEFFDKMHKTQKRKEVIQKKPESKKLSESEIEVMVQRLSGTNLQRYVERKAQRKANMDTTILERSSICHRFQPRKTRDLARKARETSSSEIFDVLLISVEHYHHTRANTQREMEERLEAMPDEKERRRSDSLNYHHSVEQHTDRGRVESSKTMEIESDLFGAKGEEEGQHEAAQSQSKKVMSPGPLNDFAPSAELKEYAYSEREHQLLDTVHAQPRFLQPLALAEAIEIVLRDARPHHISREDFIDRVEILINSGVGPPINAILIAPQRPVRYKHSKEMEAEKHVKPPTLAASKASTRMAANRTRANIRDPMKYARDRSDRLEKLRKFKEEKEMEACTFRPSIQTEDSWNIVRRSHDKHYQDVIYKPTRQVSKPALFKRDTVMRPTTSSIKHRATDDQVNRIKVAASREREPEGAEDGAMDEMQAHQIHREMEFIYVDSPPPAAKKNIEMGPGDYVRMVAKVQKQHDQEFSSTNAHSASHMPMFRSHKDHIVEEVQEAAKLSERKHVADDFEKVLAEVEGKIKDAVDMSSAQSTSTTSSGYLARHEAISGRKVWQ